MVSYLQEWFNNRKPKKIIHYCNVSHNTITSITEHVYLVDTKLKNYVYAVSRIKAGEVNIQLPHNKHL